jgi:hypothetical protein
MLLAGCRGSNRGRGWRQQRMPPPFLGYQEKEGANFVGRVRSASNLRCVTDGLIPLSQRSCIKSAIFRYDGPFARNRVALLCAVFQSVCETIGDALHIACIAFVQSCALSCPSKHVSGYGVRGEGRFRGFRRFCCEEEPYGLPEAGYWQASDREAQLRRDIQGRPGLPRWVHEHCDGADGGVCGWALEEPVWGLLHPRQQR